MFDVGFWEILLILILALVVIGPERLPGAARTLGLWVGKGRRYIEGVKSEVEQEFDISEFKRVIHNQEIQLNELQQKVSQSTRMSADDLLGTHEHTHNIVEETPASEEELVASEESSVVGEEEKVDQQIKNPE
jgi:sec-independent protein translocase protein TatB